MVTRANTAVNVFGTEVVDARIQRIQRRLGQFRVVLQEALRHLVRELLRRVPVRTGRLYRSFRIRVTRTQVLLTFEAPYAIYANALSKRNRMYIERGLRAGIRRANATQRTTSDGATVRFQFRRQSIRRWGRRGGAQVILNYRGL